jgi:predicted ATPase
LKGAFLSQQENGAEDAAEVCFNDAVAIAQQQHAKIHELSATVALCKMWRRRNRLEHARALLAKICQQFSEGFTSPPLLEAQGLLEQLTH